MKRILIFLSMLLSVSTFAQNFPSSVYFRQYIDSIYSVVDVRNRTVKIGGTPLAFKTINGETITGTGNLIVSGSGGAVYPSGSGIPLVVGGTSWGTTITNNSSNWNTAYGWGNHASAGYYVGSSSTIRGLISSTEAGLTYTSGTGVFSLTSGYVIPTTTSASNWNTAYGWGNHATPGYYVGTSSTIRGLFSSTATGLTYTNGTGVFSLTSGYSIPTTVNQSNWSTAYGWGNHAGAGYAPLNSATFTGTITLPSTTSIGLVSSTEIGYINNLSGEAASKQNINDSIDYYLANAVEVISKADSTSAVGKASGSYVTGMDWDNGNIPSQLKALQAFGASMKAVSVFGFNPTVGHSLSDATCVGIAVYINEPMTVTGAGWIQLGVGDYTAADYNGFALYRVSGTTYTLVASTTSDGNMWKSAAFTINQRAFVGNPISLSVGAYYLVSFYNQSAQVTSPGVFHSPNIYNAIIVGITGTNKTCWLRYTTTTVPSSITAASTYALVEPPVYWLY